VTPILPLLGENLRFFFARDLPGIGDSEIPRRLDMKTAAIRIHGLAAPRSPRKLGWWHDIGLMVAYATRAVPRGSGETVVMDAFSRRG